jgi:hypothetical protein
LISVFITYSLTHHCLHTSLLATPIHQQSKHHQMEAEQPNQSPTGDKKADNPEHINIKVREAPLSRHAQNIY